MDTITKANELNYFFWSMICGVAMTIVYDFLRARRREKKQVGLFIYIEDIVWFCVLGVLVYLLAFRQNAGMIRWYSFFVIGLGALIYKLLLGDKLMNVFRKCYSYFVRAFCFLIKIIMWPVRFIAALIKRPIGVVVWHSRTGSRQLSDMMKVSKQRLRNRMRYKARKTNSSEEDE